MPELAEVEFYRTRWNPGINHKVVAVYLHATKRLFRGTDTKDLTKRLTGAKLLHSETHGKQMLFHFSGGAWLGIHLGMSGKLRVEEPDFVPDKHDHLALQQKAQTLVFSDPRQFGRVVFDFTKDAPSWWKKLPPRIGSKEFTNLHFNSFLQRHGKAPIKAVLLMQAGLPGVGNWMADEILWQAQVNPKKIVQKLTPAESTKLFRKTESVCDQALQIIGKDFSDPPESWLFRHRWKKKANCPKCKTPLHHAVVGGRTTCWCQACQK